MISFTRNVSRNNWDNEAKKLKSAFLAYSVNIVSIQNSNIKHFKQNNSKWVPDVCFEK